MSNVRLLKQPDRTRSNPSAPLDFNSPKSLHGYHTSSASFCKNTNSGFSPSSAVRYLSIQHRQHNLFHTHDRPHFLPVTQRNKIKRTYQHPSTFSQNTPAQPSTTPPSPYTYRPSPPSTIHPAQQQTGTRSKGYTARSGGNR